MRWLWLSATMVACSAPAVVPVDAGEELPDAAVADAGQPTPDAGVVITTVVVHYPAGAHTVTIRGSRAPYYWNHGAPMAAGALDTWSVALPALTGELEFKPLLDDATWSKGPNYRVTPGQTVEVWPHFTRAQGQWSRRWTDFHSTLLNNTRGVWVYLPPTALENPRARFPVVYMHDGQNLFDPAAAFGGVSWAVADTLDAAAEDGTIREAVVVGPENTAARIDEYTPTVDATYGGGKADTYLRMLVEELKPKVDAELPVLTARADTVVMGSSLGGLVSSYAGVKKPEVFGLIGAMSPSTWWDNNVLLTFVAQTGAAPARPLKVYVDCGDGSADGYAETRLLPPAYRGLGYTDGTTLKFVVDPGAQHNETYWARRLPGALQFLLGPR